MNKSIYFLFFLLFLSRLAFAGTGLASFWDEIGYVYSEGLYDETNLYTAVGLGAAWAGTFPCDERLLTPVGGEGKTASDAGEILNYPGKFAYIISASALTWGIGYLAGWDEVAGTGRDVTASLLMSGLTVTAVKTAVGRARPRMRRGAYDFGPFTIEDDRQSLPSGDAAVAFAWASVLAERTKSWPVAIASYTLATAASWSRINKRAHWPSDVCLGALIGILYGRACGKYDADEQGGKDKVISVGMYIDPVRGFAGIQLSW